MGFRVSEATLSDHRAAERRMKDDKLEQATQHLKTFFIVGVPVPAKTNGLEKADFPYYMPTFESLADAEAWREAKGLTNYGIRRTVLEHSGVQG